jgi:hypothetical protein
VAEALIGQQIGANEGNADGRKEHHKRRRSVRGESAITASTQALAREQQEQYASQSANGDETTYDHARALLIPFLALSSHSAVRSTRGHQPTLEGVRALNVEQNAQYSSGVRRTSDDGRLQKEEGASDID